jgi:hypothetical protein
MGIHKEVRKMFGSSILNYIISARTAQGYEQWKSSTQEERLDIVSRWNEGKMELQSERQKVLEAGPEGQESGRLTPTGFLQTRHLSFDERKKLHEDRRLKREHERTKLYGERHSRCPFCSKSSTHQHPQNNPGDAEEEGVSRVSSDPSMDPQHEEFEQAIRASVAATSRGNPEEDLMIERAIRASVRELQSSSGSSSTVDQHEAMDRAIQASVAEATKSRNHTTTSDAPSDSEWNALLEKSIQQSLYDTGSPAPYQQGIQMTNADVDTDDDDDVKRAIEASKAVYEEDASNTKTEEDIVMEYIKKQSLAEEEHRKTLLGKQREAIVSQDAPVEDDEDLQRAIKESMKTL